MFCLHVCICIICMSGAQGGQRRESPVIKALWIVSEPPYGYWESNSESSARVASVAWSRWCMVHAFNSSTKQRQVYLWAWGQPHPHCESQDSNKKSSNKTTSAICWALPRLHLFRDGPPYSWEPGIPKDPPVSDAWVLRLKAYPTLIDNFFFLDRVSLCSQG